MLDSRYDPEADAVYVQVGTTKIVDSPEVAPNIILESNAEKHVVGIEVSHASQTLSPSR